MYASAEFSACERYRYELARAWDYKLPRVCFIMLNPSTADQTHDDATIRRCIGFAGSWNYGGIEVVNLFAYRATDPRELKQPGDVVGPANDEHILTVAKRCAIVICAWGNHGKLDGRGKAVLKLLEDNNIKPHCLRVSKTGEPCHPLYLEGTLQPKVMH